MLKRRIAIRVSDLRHREEGGYTLMANWFARPHIPEETCHIVDLVAYCNHMPWLKLCTDNLGADIRDWKKTFAAHLAVFHVIGWKEKMMEPQDDSGGKKTIPCRTCKRPIKQSATPSRFYGGNTMTSHWNRSWVPSNFAENEWMAGTFEAQPEYPLLDVEWRSNEDTSVTASKFLALAESEFNPSRVKELAELGDVLVEERNGEIRYAARKIQEIEMRKMADQVEAAGLLLKFDPVMRDQVMQIHTRGAMPHFHGKPQRGIAGSAYHMILQRRLAWWKNLERCPMWARAGDHIKDCRAGNPADRHSDNRSDEKTSRHISIR